VTTKDRDSVEAVEPFRFAVEASPTGVLIVDADGTIVLLNRELERQFGYAREELVGARSICSYPKR
jgi:PAS domain S-box-containing protein